MITRRNLLAAPALLAAQSGRRPNILFAIADDWSFAHAGAMGDKVVRTPAFDEVAGRGTLFTTAVSGSPGCAPSRAAILTGRPHWQLEEAGTHASLFPKKFQVFPDLLAGAGYHIGVTGKGAGPCNWKESGWKHNPAGPDYSRIKADAPKGMANIDYAANFDEFLTKRQNAQPFFFWYGCQEPHRAYERGAGKRAGKRGADVNLPPFLPDDGIIREDILDYYNEVEHFDVHLGRMLRAIEKAGELDNTLVVVTADNGMPFPGSKATMLDYGIHLPLAICWKGRFKGGRKHAEPVSFTDFAPTFLEAAGVSIPVAMTGRSLLPVLEQGRRTAADFALSGRERHSHARADNLGYPARALRTSEHLFIRNFAPDRVPAGDPPLFADIDASPSKDYVMKNRVSGLGLEPFPSEQMFDVRTDPGCRKNLATDPRLASKRDALRAQLERELTRLKDPRVLGNGDIFESYPRYSAMRPELGGFAKQGEYNDKYRR